MASARVRISSIVVPCGKVRSKFRSLFFDHLLMAMASPRQTIHTQCDRLIVAHIKLRSLSIPSSRSKATSPMVSFDPSPFERRTMPAISSAERFSTPVRTRMLDPNTSPAGSALTSSAMALAIWRIVMSSATNFAVGTSITTCGAAMPWIEVLVTPALNNRSANSSRSGPIASHQWDLKTRLRSPDRSNCRVR